MPGLNVIVKLQILKDEATRGQYDYAIAHPEEVLLTSFVQLKMYHMGLFYFNPVNCF